jgi:hypothetical protein
MQACMHDCSCASQLDEPLVAIRHWFQEARHDCWQLSADAPLSRTVPVISTPRAITASAVQPPSQRDRLIICATINSQTGKNLARRDDAAIRCRALDNADRMNAA